MRGSKSDIGMFLEFDDMTIATYLFDNPFSPFITLSGTSFATIDYSRLCVAMCNM